MSEFANVDEDVRLVRGSGSSEVRSYQLAMIHAERSEAEEFPEADASPRIKALREAEHILSRAREDAEKLRNAAREERETLRARTIEEARAATNLRADAELRALREPLAALLDGLRQEWEAFCLAQVPRLAPLCIDAVEKILQAQLTLEPERVRDIVKAAIAHVPQAEHLVVIAHPDDLKLLQDEALTSSMGAQHLLYEADPTLRRGGCRIESRQGVVDASMEGAMRRLVEMLEEDGDDV